MTEFYDTGFQQFISSEQQINRQKIMDKEIAQCEREKKHYFIAVVSFKVNPPMQEGSVLDAENLRGIPGIGCYICEEPYSKNMPKRCPGEPRL